MINIPVKLRRPYSSIYMESDKDFVLNNIAACVEFLERELIVDNILDDYPTPEMLVNGARSIGNTMRTANHQERARLCYESMQKALEGYVEPKPDK